MKKFSTMKTIQLILFLLLAGAALSTILTDPELYQLVGRDPRICALCFLFWATLGLSFIFIFLDFGRISTLKRDYRELNYAVASDPVSGIANRYSCDAVIEKYMDQHLPDRMGCVMFALSNLAEANRRFGHSAGNDMIRDFSNILQAASMDQCFIGRNGGNQFLALFEDCDQNALDDFLARVITQVREYNGAPTVHPIGYRCGSAYNENSDFDSITELITCSSRQLYCPQDDPDYRK